MHSLVVVLKCLYGEENGQIVSKISLGHLFLNISVFWLFLEGINSFANTLEKCVNYKIKTSLHKLQ